MGGKEQAVSLYATLFTLPAFLSRQPVHVTEGATGRCTVFLRQVIVLLTKQLIRDLLHGLWAYFESKGNDDNIFDASADVFNCLLEDDLVLHRPSVQQSHARPHRHPPHLHSDRCMSRAGCSLLWNEWQADELLQGIHLRW